MKQLACLCPRRVSLTCQDTVLFLKASMVGRWDCKVVTETLIGTIFLNEEYPLFCVSFFLFELLSRYIKLNIQRGGLYTSIHVVYIYIYMCVCVYVFFCFFLFAIIMPVCTVIRPHRWQSPPSSSVQLSLHTHWEL